MAPGHGLRRLPVWVKPGMTQSAPSSAWVRSARISASSPPMAASAWSPDPETEIGRHLVVARAPGVQTARGFADDLLQAGLDIHVDVFQRGRELEAAALDL